MANAVLSVNTTLSASIWNIIFNPPGTYSFSISAGSNESFFVTDDDATFDDTPYDGNQLVAPASSIFTDNAPVTSHYTISVTPDNGDPTFTIYVVFENTTAEDIYGALNTLDYAFVSEVALIPGVNYSVNSATNNGAVNYDQFSNLLVCFAVDALIRTPRGQVAAGQLRVGDLVETLDHGPQPIRWVGQSSHSWSAQADPAKPILVAAGSLGADLPVSDLVVSAQHRILVPQGAGTALAPAKGLTRLRGVRQMSGCRQIDLVHILCDRHEIVFANGAPCESFFPGRMAIAALGPADQQAVQAHLRRIAPTSNVAAARPFLRVKQTLRDFDGTSALWTHDRLAGAVTRRERPGNRTSPAVRHGQKQWAKIPGAVSSKRSARSTGASGSFAPMAAAQISSAGWWPPNLMECR